MTSRPISPGTSEYTVSQQVLQPDTNDLLGALLTASHQNNEMLAQLLLHTKKEAEKPSQQQVKQHNWKQADPDLSKRIGEASTHLNKIFEGFLSDFIDDIMELEEEDVFNLREFCDKYGPQYSHLAQILVGLQSLSS